MIETDNISYLNRGYDKNKLRKIVFMDRDGTIHIDKIETHLIGDLEFFPDTVSFMQKVTSLGYDIIVVTNQSGIGKGHYDIETMKEFNLYMVQELGKYGISILAVLYCPHVREDNCPCMKPKSGIFEKARELFNIDMSNSIMVGDQTSDVLASINTGITKNYLVTTGIYDGKYVLPTELNGKVTVCKNLTEAEEHISQNHL